MALSNPIPSIQGSRIYHGPDLQEDSFLIAPGVSDYVTNGYVLTAIALRFKSVQRAWVSGFNATATGYTPQCVFPIAQMGATVAGAGFTGYSQFLFKVLVVTTGVEVANAGNLTGAVWAVTVLGF
jgi:hypothetical protein